MKIIHERDQFLQNIPPREFPLTHSVHSPYGDFWSVTVPIASAPPPTPGSAWGSPGRYVYRYRINNPNVGSLDWIIDPCAREFGVGKLSAFTLGYQPYTWNPATEANWHTPALQDLVFYEVNISELGGDLERTRNLMAYLNDLGVNAIEVMPLSNVAASVDWAIFQLAISAWTNALASVPIFRRWLTLRISTASPSWSMSCMGTPASTFRISTPIHALNIARTHSWDLSRKIISATSARAPTSNAN